MRLGINTLTFGSFTNTSGNIVPLFIRQLSVDNKTWRIVVFLRSDVGMDGGFPPNVEFVHVKAPHFPLAWFFYQQLVLPFKFRRHNLDKMLTISQAFIYALGRKNLFMLYDFDFLRFPTEYSLYTRLTFRTNLFFARLLDVRCAVPTYYIREEAINLFKFAPKNIDVVPLGVPFVQNRELDYPGLLRDLRARFKINKNYFFYIGSDVSHKNISRTVEGFSLFNAKEKGNYMLVLSGRSFSADSKVSRHIQNKKLKNILCTGEITDDEKIALYSGAAALLFLSFYEGFGLPLIEAQSLGTPVIAADIGASKEVLGESALLADPFDIGSIVDTLLSFANNKKTNSNLISKGYENVQRFSWEKSASLLKKALIK